MKRFSTILNEAAEGSNKLQSVLNEVWESYVEETGDQEGKDYDIGLGILEVYADKFPADVAAQIAEDLDDIFGAGEMDEELEEEEEIVEGMKVVKKKKKTSAEKQEAHKDYMKDKSKTKLQNKKWRKSAAGKKWLEKYEKFKKTHKLTKGKRISTT